jgi:transposase
MSPDEKRARVFKAVAEGVPAREAAAAFGVAVRTVYRWLESARETA